MCALVEGTFATGSHAFHPGRDYTPASHNSNFDNESQDLLQSSIDLTLLEQESQGSDPASVRDNYLI